MSFPRQSPLCRLCWCSFPPRTRLEPPQRLTYVVLPSWLVHMCNRHSLPSYGQDVASAASPSHLGHAFPALSNSHTEWILQNSSDRPSLLRSLTPAPTSWGRSRSLKQSAGRASDSGVLVDIPNSTERKRLSYVCNPRSLKEGMETYIPSPQSL